MSLPGISIFFEAASGGGAGVSTITSSAVTDVNSSRATGNAIANPVAGSYGVNARLRYLPNPLATIQVTQAAMPPPPATHSARLTAPDGKPITLSVFTTESACAISRAQVIDPRAALFTADGVPPAAL